MVKNIGVLAAVAFVLGTQGVTAASISEARLQELLSSTSAQAVSLETLRARDREILEGLAQSLAERYSDVLAGSEMVFTRLSESGSIFYRLDFIGLKNRDRARAMCEILEMERCIARIGNDRLTVLEVRSDPIVSAIAIVEQDDVEPFDFFFNEPEPQENPKAREIEANVRSLLDPLRTYPEPRPDLQNYLPDAAPPQTDPVDEDQASLFPIPRPDLSRFQVAAAHPVPLARPDARLAGLVAPQPHKVAIYPLARPFGAIETALAEVPSAPVVKLIEVADAPSANPTIETGPEGFAEVAEAVPAIAPAAVEQAVVAQADELAPEPVIAAPEDISPAVVVADAPTPIQKTMTSVMRMPGASDVDMPAIRASARQFEAARSVFSNTADQMLVRTPAQSKSLTKPQIIASAIQERRGPAPTPLLREAALDDFASRTADRSIAMAFEAGAAAPKPMIREYALISVAPTPAVMTSIAALFVPDAIQSVQINLPQTLDVSPQIASSDAMPDPDASIDVAMVAPSNPEPAPVMIAEVETVPEKTVMVVADIVPAPEPVRKEPRRLTIKMPEAAVDTAVAETAPVEQPVSVARRLLETASIEPDIAQLGRVSFDDRYAQPASVDFNDGRVAGRLQKLPYRRPDLTGYRTAKSAPARPILEAGADRSTAMLSDARAPFEIAQVPSLGAVEKDASEPFSMEEPGATRDAPASMLDRLLDGQSADRPMMPEPVVAPVLEDFQSGATVPASVSVFGTAAPAAPTPAVQANPAPRPSLPGAIEQTPQAALPTLNLTREMQVVAPKSVQPQPVDIKPVASVVAPEPAQVVAPQPQTQVVAPAARTMPDLSGTFEGSAASQQAYQARQIEDEAAKQRRALDALGEIVKARQTQQVATATQETAQQPTTRRDVFPSVDGTSQRRAYPRTENAGNTDMNAAREISGYQSTLGDNRTDMARAANPLGRISPAERMQRHTSLDQAYAPADLRIELSYVGSRDEVMKRVEELKGFFPPVMTTKGRFFGSTVPENPDRFVVGIAAHDMAARDDIVWYLEQMQIPWAIR